METDSFMYMYNILKFIFLKLLFHLGTNYWRNRVLKVAKKMKNKVMNFAIASSPEFERELAEFGVSDTSGDKPVATIKNEAGEKFVMKDSFEYVYHH